MDDMQMNTIPGPSEAAHATAQHTRRAPTLRAVFASALAAALALALFTVTGCAQQTQSQESNVVTPSDYMVSLNAAADNLKSVFTEFTDAASSDDIFTMQAKIDEASAAIDEMCELEAPEAMDEVKAKYTEALSTLKATLSDYLDLYLELDDAQQGGAAFDYSTFSDRLEELQMRYDQGLGLLEDADKLATDLQSSTD